MIKNLLRRGALAAGLHVGRFPARDSLQGHLKKFFQLTGVNCVLDVGAHDGEYAHELREIGYRGRIVSFEPVQSSYQGLVHKARRARNWVIHNLALGAEEGEKEINVYRGGVFNSFLSSSEFGTERFGAELALATTQRVRVARVDHILADCVAGIESPRVFLKMDTQGWDLEVLKGAGGVISQLVGIQSELAIKQCYQGMVGFAEALKEYSALGFEVTGLFPVAHDKDELRVVELDCVMLRAPAREVSPDSADSSRAQRDGADTGGASVHSTVASRSSAR